MGFEMVTQGVGILDLTYKVKLLKWMIRKTLSGGKQAVGSSITSGR